MLKALAIWTVLSIGVALWIVDWATNLAHSIGG